MSPAQKARMCADPPRREKPRNRGSKANVRLLTTCPAPRLPCTGFRYIFRTSMCGIAGIIGRISDRNRAALQRMSDAMIHRGPDGHGTWESPPDGRGFGALLTHRRLAILDLSPTGAQPMVDP